MEKTLYHTNNDKIHVLRFYSDNSVKAGLFNQIENFDKSFFQSYDNKENTHPNYTNGRYTFNYNELEFKLNFSSGGGIKYKGKFINEDELNIEIISPIDGSIEKRRYSSISSYPKRNDYPDLTEEYYPMVLIPKNIRDFIEREISRKEILNALAIKEPILKQLNEPRYPDRYFNKAYKRIKIEGKLTTFIFQLSIGILFILLMFISLENLNLIYSLIIIIIGIAISGLQRINIINEFKKIEYSENEFNAILDNYKLSLLSIQEENKILENEYIKEIKYFNSRIYEDQEKAQMILLRENLKPKTKFKITKNETFIKRGKSELQFLGHLLDKFGSQIIADGSLNTASINYLPDFIFICKETGLHIDIEIDEPYSFNDKKAIHYIGSIDEERNHYFLDQNWCVIRFTEKQVIKEPENCVKLIETLISSIQREKIRPLYKITKEKRWTYEEALVLMSKNERNNY